MKKQVKTRLAELYALEAKLEKELSITREMIRELINQNNLNKHGIESSKAFKP